MSATDENCAANTDREIWRKGDGDGNGMSYYEPSIFVTEQGAIGINVGGWVYVKPVEDWHALVSEQDALDMALRFACGELAGEEVGIDQAQAHFDRLVALGNEYVAEKRRASLGGVQQ